jgi:hypothetical protein
MSRDNWNHEEHPSPRHKPEEKRDCIHCGHAMGEREGEPQCSDCGHVRPEREVNSAEEADIEAAAKYSRDIDTPKMSDHVDDPGTKHQNLAPFLHNLVSPGVPMVEKDSQGNITTTPPQRVMPTPHTLGTDSEGNPLPENAVLGDGVIKSQIKFIVEKDGVQTELRVHYDECLPKDLKELHGLNFDEELAKHLGREIVEALKNMSAVKAPREINAKGNVLHKLDGVGYQEMPESIKEHQPNYKPDAWKTYTISELGDWVHLFLKRAKHRTDKAKARKDVMDAQNYLNMMQSEVDAVRKEVS